MITFAQIFSMIFKVNPDFNPFRQEIQQIFNDFEEKGEIFIQGNRNQIKLFELNEWKINVKSFKIPNKLNQFVYRFIRKSKARRSFEFAQILIEKGSSSDIFSRVLWIICSWEA